MSSVEKTPTPEDNNQTYGDALVEALALGGVDYLFFTSGSEVGFYQEGIAKAQAKSRNKPPRLVTVPLEHVALNAALGYAAVSGRPAATAAHVDCGTLHYGGALHTAWRSGLPVIITAGYPPTANGGTMPGSRTEGGHIWVQETYDQNGIVRNYTKWDRRLTYQDNPGMVMSRAIQVAVSEPAGPVYLSIPKELTVLPTNGLPFPSAQQLGIPRPAAPDPGAVEDIATRLVAARNPVAIVAGSGRNPASVAPLVELCELLGMAVIDSANVSYTSFPYTHHLYQDQAVLKDADLVLAIEAEVPWIPTRIEPPETAFVATIDIDPIKLRIPTYEFPADIRIAADPQLTIEALTQAVRDKLTPAELSTVADRTKQHEAAAARAVTTLRERGDEVSADAPIDPFWLSYKVTEALDENCILLDDTLGVSGILECLRITKAGGYFRNVGSSGGWGPGAALGAKLAAPDKDIVVVTGDGFYMFGTPAPAIWAAAHYGAPFLTVVYTNRSYTTGTLSLARMYGPEGYAARSGFEGGYFDPPIDYAKEAEAAGAYGENVDDPAEVGPAIERGLEAIRNGRPAVISVWLKRLVDDK